MGGMHGGGMCGKWRGMHGSGRGRGHACKGVCVVGASVARRHAWQVVCVRGACMAGGMHVWQGACVVGAGGVCGRAGDTCMAGGMHGRRCVHGRGACMAGKGHACHAHPQHHDIRSVNARAVRILLECILVISKFTVQGFSSKLIILITTEKLNIQYVMSCFNTLRFYIGCL